MITEKTIAEYIDRASKLILRAEYDIGHVNLDALEIAQWLIARKDSFSKSTWRKYRASLKFVFKKELVLGNMSDVITDAIKRLEQTPPPVGPPETPKTSAQKLKKINYDELFKLHDHIDKKTPLNGLATLYWLYAGIWTGLRPSEWEHAIITEGNQLKVLNAKTTQGRSHGNDRHINIANLDSNKIEIIKLHLKNVQQAKFAPEKKRRSGFEQFYDSCRSCLYYATRKVWPKRKKYITLYTPRHQFSADAKFDGQSKEEIAALMGHASIETATTHYGRRSAGRSGFQVSANSQDVERVQALNQHRMNSGHSTMGM